MKQIEIDGQFFDDYVSEYRSRLLLKRACEISRIYSDAVRSSGKPFSLLMAAIQAKSISLMPLVPDSAKGEIVPKRSGGELITIPDCPIELRPKTSVFVPNKLKNLVECPDGSVNIIVGK